MDAWTRIPCDKNDALRDFAQQLERLCIETIDVGEMTKDLALIIHCKSMKREHYLNTFEFLDRLAFNLQKKQGLKPSL